VEMSFIEALEEYGNNSYIDIFEADCIQSMIAFKWNRYGHQSHFLGFAMHCFLIITITTYIYNTYLIGLYGEATDEIYTYAMIVGIIYPFIYDSI